MPISLMNYKGLDILNATPTGAGGEAIQNDFINLVDWHPKSLWDEAGVPGTADDENDDFQIGSLWMQTGTPPLKLFVCWDSTANYAQWASILLQIVQDLAPKLGGNLDVNGKQIVSLSNGNIVLLPNGTGKIGLGTSSPNSTVTTGGPIATPVTSPGGSTYTILATDSVISTSGAITLTLPTAVGITGREYRIKRMNASGTVTINTTASQTIDGITSISLTAQYQFASLVSNGANWMRF